MEEVSPEQVEAKVAATSSDTAPASSSVSPSNSAPAKRKPEDFRFGKLIGEGSFSSVYLAKDVKNGNECAIKVCQKQLIIREKKAELIKREKEVMTILSANKDTRVPFFVKLHATFQDSERLYFVMTYARGGEMLKYITRKPKKPHFFDLECCRFYTGELVTALAHLHSLNIVHRDLKPENILLSEKGHILITDFGSAKILNNVDKSASNEEVKQEKNSNDTSKAPASDSESTPSAERPDESPRRPLRRNNSFVGTAQYVSPEVLQGKYSEVGPAADLWALGCILYQFAFGSPPFTATNEYLIFQKILKLNYEFPENMEYSSDARDLIESLLKLDHKERLGVQDITRYTSLESHSFFNGADIHSFYEQNPTPLYKYLTSSEDVEGGEPIHSNSYKVPDSFAPGFNPQIMAQRALQDEDDLPFSIANTNTTNMTKQINTSKESNHGPLIEDHSKSKTSQTESSKIQKNDELLNNANIKTYTTDANSNNDNSNNSSCGCKCILF